MMDNAGVSSRWRARLPWAFVPVVLLVSSALGVGGMAVVAVRDEHFGADPAGAQGLREWTYGRAGRALMSGYLLHGQWQTGWYDTRSTGGEFVRHESSFRHQARRWRPRGPYARIAFPLKSLETVS